MAPEYESGYGRALLWTDAAALNGVGRGRHDTRVYKVHEFQLNPRFSGQLVLSALSEVMKRLLFCPQFWPPLPLCAYISISHHFLRLPLPMVVPPWR